MTVEQYRCLCAHMSYWSFGLKKAMADCGITISQELVIDELFKAGWTYYDLTDTLEYKE